MDLFGGVVRGVGSSRTSRKSTGELLPPGSGSRSGDRIKSPPAILPPVHALILELLQGGGPTPGPPVLQRQDKEVGGEERPSEGHHHGGKQDGTGPAGVGVIFGPLALSLTFLLS